MKNNKPLFIAGFFAIFFTLFLIFAINISSKKMKKTTKKSFSKPILEEEIHMKSEEKNRTATNPIRKATQMPTVQISFSKIRFKFW